MNRYRLSTLNIFNVQNLMTLLFRLHPIEEKIQKIPHLEGSPNISYSSQPQR
jgi:hypothetical protein